MDEREVLVPTLIKFTAFNSVMSNASSSIKLPNDKFDNYTNPFVDEDLMRVSKLNDYFHNVSVEFHKDKSFTKIDQNGEHYILDMIEGDIRSF